MMVKEKNNLESIFPNILHFVIVSILMEWLLRES